MVESPQSPKGASRTGSPKSPSKGPSKSPPKSPADPGSTGARSTQSPSPPGPATTTTGTVHPETPMLADDDVDETFDLDNNASSSASIASSIMRYRYEHGRRYHAYKAGAYFAPNDDTESERLDLQHHMYHLTLDGKLFLCPADPSNFHRVLDCGTGVGSWAIDYGDYYPNSQVIGVDLSPTQPTFVPPNVEFFVDDLEDEWNYSHPFDFIYSRMETGSISDWPRFFQQSFDNLKPGGWIEVTDNTFPLECDDDSLPESSALYQWSALFLEASIKFNKPVDSAKHYGRQLEEAGFVNIVEQKFRWPVNHWPKDPHFKELGLLMYENMGRNVSGLSLGFFTRILGWSREKLEVFLIDVRKQIKDPSYHAYVPIHVIYAQKPTEA